MSSLGFLLCGNLTSSFFLSQGLFGFTGVLKPRLSTIKQLCFLFVSDTSLSSPLLLASISCVIHAKTTGFIAFVLSAVGITDPPRLLGAAG